MKTGKILIAAAGAAMLLAGCDVKDPIYETAHPDHGKITLTTDWTGRGTGIDIPSSYTVKVGDYSTTLNGTTNTIDNLFTPGSYTAYVWNTADKIAVSGTTATANYTEGTPGWFFTSKLTETIAADTDHEFTAVMRQQVIEMTFTVTPSGGTTDKIESITATLGGIAGAMDMDTDARSAKTTIPLSFAKQSDGTWKVTVRVLGIVGDEQPLTTTVKFTGGEPADVTDTTDIHDEIKDNFTDDGTPKDPGGSGSGDIDLGTEIVETPTGAGFTATITGWTPVSGGSVIAN